MRNRLLAVLLLLLVTLGAPLGARADVQTEGFLFSDVSESAWYYDAVAFSYANSVLKGISADEFRPNSGTTREQMMVVLAKLSEDDIKGADAAPFTDVRYGAWYADYVNWAYDKGYTSGVSETLFGIGYELTREEAVTLIYNYSIANSLSQPEGEIPDSYADREDVSLWAREAFGWAIHHSVVKGDNNGRLNPRAIVKRSELSVIIRAFLENIAYGSCEHSYNDDDCTVDMKCRTCPLIKSLGRADHEYIISDCTEGGVCKNCSAVLGPMGHNYLRASCTSAMECTACGMKYGSALGHTTDNGICGRCKTEIFADSYAKFAYYMTHSARVEGNMRYLCADVTHADGNTSRQYIRYNTDTGKANIEIIFKFSKNNHYISTVIEFSRFSSMYVATSEYKAGDKVVASATANIYSAYINKDHYVDLSGYTGKDEHKELMRRLVKNSVLLSVDSSDKLLSLINMSIKDMGFTNFY